MQFRPRSHHALPFGLVVACFAMAPLACSSGGVETLPGVSSGGSASGGSANDSGGSGSGGVDGDGGSAGGAGALGGMGGMGGAGCEKSACPLPFTGVNLAGAEFGEDYPGVYETDYIYPGAADFSYFADQGMTIIRLPFRWERLQPTLGEEFDNAELTRLQQAVSLGTDRGMRVILDPHNYARYQRDGEELLLGDGQLTSAQFAHFWERLAELYRDEALVWFGLMNEPHDMPTGDWVAAANAAISAIRDAGAENQILVPGNHWTGAHSWTNTDNAQLMLQVEDPLDNMAFDVHQYFNFDFSGATADCDYTDGGAIVADLTAWLEANGHQAFLGEFGVGDDANCRVALDSLMQHMQTHREVWLGWTYWAGGPWWGDYFFSIAPAEDGSDKPQMTWLRDFL